MEDVIDGGGEPRVRTTERLATVAATAKGPTVTLGEVLDGLGEQAYGVVLLVLALPCCIPFLYGVPQIVALPLLLVSAQLALGRPAPWMPDTFRARPIAVARIDALLRKSDPYIAWLERMSRERFGALTRPPLERLVGVMLLIFSTSILTPVPGTNTVPGIAVAIVSLGLLKRDGAFVLVGLLLGSLWVAALLMAGGGVILWMMEALGVAESAGGAAGAGAQQ